jgi:methyl-accepting chemotaxis protein
MKNWTIGKRITLGFASIIAIFALLGASGYSLLTAINGHSEHVARQTSPTVQLCDQIGMKARDSAQAVYKHLGSSDREDMARLDEQIKAGAVENTKTMEKIEQLNANEKYRDLLASIRTAQAEYRNAREAVLVLSRQGTKNLAAYNLARTQLDPAMARYLATLQALIDFSRAEENNATQGIVTAVNTAKMGMLAGILLTLVMGAGMAFLITRNTNRALNTIAADLNEGSNQVAASSGQVSSSSQSLAGAASEQAASLEETSSSLEEMASMTKRNAGNAQKANELAKETRTEAEKGAADMQAMSAAMAAIKVSSDDIAKIIKTIDEIAFQTNILALNAAVEAARAGEAGMGFAVVADEVRNLAQRSAQAAKETSAKIEGAIGKTGQGVEISGKVVKTLGEIVNRVRQLDDLIAEVAGASREQTQGIDQVNLAVSQMDQVTQTNAANAEEMAASAQELTAQASLMKRAVTGLVALVGTPPQHAPARQSFSTLRAGTSTISLHHVQVVPSQGRFNAPNQPGSRAELSGAKSDPNHKVLTT